MYYLHTVPFQHRTPPLFCHYQLCQLSSYLLSIHLDLPECIVYINFLFYPKSCPCCSRICPFLHNLFHWDLTTLPHKLEFNPEDSRTNTPKVYHCTVPHIVQQDGHTFPTSFHLLNTGNDAIYSTPWYLSVPFQFCPHQGKQLKTFLFFLIFIFIYLSNSTLSCHAGPELIMLQ